MQRSKHLLFIILGISLLSPCAYSQEQDSILEFEQFMEQVRQHHPVVRQASIVEEKGDAAIQSAWGQFDPVLSAGHKEKEFEGTNYYQTFSSSFRIPAWYGISLEAGYDNNAGEYLNPQNTTGQAGLIYAGVKVPVGQGLIIDKRRAALKMARAYSQMSQSERDEIINDLLLDAAKTYWNWYITWKEMDIAREGMDLAQERLTAVKQGADAGDLPAIDTLEAYIQFQNRIMRWNKSKLHFTQSGLNLSQFLWLNGDSPLVLNDGVKPEENTGEANFPFWTELNLDLMASSHPGYLKNSFELSILEVDQKLKREMLKPKLDLSFTPLTEATGPSPLSGFTTNNRIVGVNFEIPVLLRQERAALTRINLDIETQNLELKQMNNLLKITASQHLAELTLLQEQIAIMEENVINYRRLVEAEHKKFEIGESSLFIVNTREINYLNAELELIQLQARRQMVVSHLNWLFYRW